MLTPNGLVLANANSGRKMYRHLFVIALSAATGKSRWIVHALPWAPAQGNVPNSKGLAPLVTPTNLLYMPFAGPGETTASVEVFSPAGHPLRRLLPGMVPTAMALARDGTLYELGNRGLVALSSTGRLRWEQANRSTRFYGSILVGVHGTIYAGDETVLVADTPSGHVLWRRTLPDEVEALAERADGVVLAVGVAGVSAISPTGTRLWHRALGRPPITTYSLPSIAVDALGRAYIGSADGVVRAITPDGAVLWTLRASGPTNLGVTPSVALGPQGTLVVAGTDGRLRVYR